MFWAVVGFYGLLGCGAAGAAGWLVREGIRARHGVARAGFADERDGPIEDRAVVGSAMTLGEARGLIGKPQPAKARAAAEQLLNEAVALPQLSAAERAAALWRIRELDLDAPDYHLSSFGASVLEMVGDSVADRAIQKEIYAEALACAERYASGASSGGEGTARSRHMWEIDAKLQGLDGRSRAAPTLPAQSRSSGATSLPPMLSPPSPARRSGFLQAIGWLFIVGGGLATPVSFISSLMILSGGDGSSGGTLLGGLIVIGGPPATLIAGIGLLRRRPWAYGYALALLAVFAGHSVVQICRGGTPERSTVSPSGLITTTLAHSPNYTAHFLIIAIAVGLLVKLRSRAIRAEF